MLAWKQYMSKKCVVLCVLLAVRSMHNHTYSFASIWVLCHIRLFTSFLPLKRLVDKKRKASFFFFFFLVKTLFIIYDSFYLLSFSALRLVFNTHAILNYSVTNFICALCYFVNCGLTDLCSLFFFLSLSSFLSTFVARIELLAAYTGLTTKVYMLLQLVKVTLLFLLFLALKFTSWHSSRFQYAPVCKSVSSKLRNTSLLV